LTILDAMGYVSPQKGNVMAERKETDQIIATISNKNNPSQIISIKYLKPENAFCTSGIQDYLGVKEILIPVYMVAKDLQLIGTILSAIMERISEANDTGTPFVYAQRFEVLGKHYTLTEVGEYMKLEDQV
jgi:hypothetical protein